MRKFKFAPGDLFLLRKVPYKFITQIKAADVDYWIIANRTDPEPVQERLTAAEIDRLYDDGLLTGDFEPDDDQAVTPKAERQRKRRTVPLSDLDQNDSARIKFRLAVVRAVEEELPRGLRNVPIRVGGELVYKVGRKTPETVLSRKLDELGSKFGLEFHGKAKTICVSSYYDWRCLLFDGEHQNDLAGDYEGRGNRNQLAPEAHNAIRDVMATLFQEAKHKKPKGKSPVVSMNQIIRHSIPKIKALQAKNPHTPNLRVPSRPTFYKIYNSFPAFLRDVATYGYTKARQMYRYPNPEQVPDGCLSVGQFDETRLPIFVIDETLGIPIGRPWLAWIADEYSSCITGFYLGFSPPSAMVIASTLRHSGSRKSYIQTEYPSIQRRYIYSGVPRLLICDNSLQAHSASICEIAGNLDVPIRFTPARMPWIKGIVEGTFHTANETWLKQMSGFVLPIGEGFDKSEYDPAENSVVGFRHLLWMLHHWLLDYYHFQPSAFTKMTPHDRWLEGTQFLKPEFLERGTDLDRIFGIVEKGRLDHRGVRYENLYYYSDEIDQLRRTYGAGIDVEVKHNPLNMSKVFVRVKGLRDRSWVEAQALEATYASKVTLHVHQLYRRHAQRVFGRSETAMDWSQACDHLCELIRTTVPDALSNQSRSLFARSMGLDTAHCFANIDHDGNLNSKLGVLADVPLDPTQPLLIGTPAPMASPLLTSRDTVSNQPEPRGAREIPVFNSDKSLVR